MANSNPNAVNFRSLIKSRQDENNKITHPHAKYNAAGQLTCSVCSCVIKSSVKWKVHILSKSHKQNEQTAVHKKPDNVDSSQLAHLKRIRGLMSKEETEANADDRVSNSKVPKIVSTTPATAAATSAGLPEDFFESKTSKSKESSKSTNAAPPPDNNTSTETTSATPAPVAAAATAAPAPPPPTQSSKLPEGFFDDPFQDAMVRHVPFKDKIDEEFELFQKEMLAVNKESEQMLEENDLEAVAERNLDTIDEHIQNWERVNKIMEKAETVINKRMVKVKREADTHEVAILPNNSQPVSVSAEDAAFSDVDDDLDWRRKKG